MCCVTIYKTKDQKLVITHNRDEQISRHQSSNEIITEMINDRKVWMPKDQTSKGTWVATNGELTGCILNGYEVNHIKKTKYKASRGTIIPLLFQINNVDKFIQEFDPIGYEPFTLLIIAQKKGIVEYGWDEQKINVKYLDTNKSHIYSSSTLYNDEVRKYREQLFFNWLKNDSSENDIWYLHTLKGNDHRHFLNVNYNTEISTVAISQIILGTEGIFHYDSLLGDKGRHTIQLTQFH